MFTVSVFLYWSPPPTLDVVFANIVAGRRAILENMQSAMEKYSNLHRFCEFLKSGEW
jgi:hypothetical protein